MIKYILATIISFALTVIALKVLVPILSRLKLGQNILSYVSEHSSKQGTPTMGGIAFVSVIAILSLLFTDNDVVVVMVAVVVGYSIIGLLDDCIKIKQRHNEGLKPYQKIVAQLSIAVIVSLYSYNNVAIGDKLYLVSASSSISIGWWAVPFIAFIFIACTNGVNLTDGLDGLATATTICYMVGMVAILAINMPYLDSVGDGFIYSSYSDIITVAMVSIGALSAFLLFNCHPAKVFMGDCGSLALGALVACVCIFSRLSLVIPVLGVMFVVSCVSVILQVGYFKVTKGERIFLMAPYHHHLQHKGYSETRIATLYSTVTMLIALLLVMGVTVWGKY